MDRLLKLSFAATLLCGAAPAFAADCRSMPPTPSRRQTEIVVTGERSEYGVRATSTATKTNTDIRDIPQALTVISESQIEDQALRSIAELLNFVPGATPGTGEGNRDQITLRGNNTTADFFIDGIRDDVQYFRDFYNVDRVEVLQGPQRDDLRPRRRRRGRQPGDQALEPRPAIAKCSLSGDSYGGVRLTGDFDQPLSATRRRAAHQRPLREWRQLPPPRRPRALRHQSDRRHPRRAGDTRIDLGYEYFHDRRTADRGVPSIAGEPLEGLRPDLLRRSRQQLRQGRRATSPRFARRASNSPTA